MKKYIKFPIKGYERVLAFFGIISEEFVVSKIANNTINRTTFDMEEELELKQDLNIKVPEPKAIPFFDLTGKVKVKKSNF